MFDRMIVSDANAVESRGRSRYFLVSSLVVGALFISAVVLSIYAVEIDLGTDEFELSMMLAPVENLEPEPPKVEQPRHQQPQQADVPTRVNNMLRPDEMPTEVPDAVSVTQNRFQARPPGRFEIGPVDSPGAGTPGETGPRIGGGSGVGTGSQVGTDPGSVAVEKVPPPPPVIAKPKNPPTISKGVINGRATSLPHPPYPAPAKMVGAQGAVSVQVTIDESGKVISAKAVDGHPLLRQAAEKAAWSAKFSPTYLSEVAVKVTGVIVYNFKR